VVAQGEHRVRPDRFKRLGSALHAAGVGSVVSSARWASDVTGRANDHRFRVPHGLGADVQRRSTRLVGPTRIGCTGSGERTTKRRHRDNGNHDSPRRPPGLSLRPLGCGTAAQEPDINGRDDSKEQQDQQRRSNAHNAIPSWIVGVIDHGNS